ncbi:retina and anterior neural fold homeobox protein 2-like [Watersipora subatra]|uniref:retina and anterior neural fold homeobox protein 2-like n=1 Tax=Watersipora subatra TaxID=2589382 RepID=UPI00355BED51
MIFLLKQRQLTLSEVKMEPSPAQSLNSFSLHSESYHGSHHATEWEDTGGTSPTSPAYSDDSGYGREFCNPLTLSFSDEYSSPSGEDGCRESRLRKVRKQRTVFETTQLEMLETTFNSNPYPSSEDYDNLAAKVSIDEARLRIWFQNRRARYRRSSKSIPSTILPSTNFPLSNFTSPVPPTSHSSVMMFGSYPFLFGRF